MNRRDMAKVVAAAAAGSVLVPSGRDPNALTDSGMLQAMRDALAQIPKPSAETQEHLRKQGQRFNEAMRRQEAIELGDRTAEELGAKFDWMRANNNPGVEWMAWLYCGAKSWSGYDPDPLTAVEKAREAALKWRDEHEQA